MESKTGVVATEPPPSPLPPLISAAALTSPEAAARLLKRQREASPVSPRSFYGSRPQSPASPVKAARLALATAARTSLSPVTLTGAAALDDERRRRRREAEEPSSPAETTQNPGHKVLAELMSSTSVQPISRPNEAPQTAPVATMEASSNAPGAIAVFPNPSARPIEGEETSPRSATSAAGIPVTASPSPMDVDKTEPSLTPQVATHDERSQAGSLSYPGSLQTSGAFGDTPSRNMSYPTPFAGMSSPPSTSGKKHKCPCCNNEFTRHHNLKSHLLTHSQEKPYVCTECQMRFRRLHDLKRHGKLHTGEKPHICPKCDRKFARGDALARHSKGQGGCAGRRSSMGSFADGDDPDTSAMMEGDESTMSGLSYDNHAEDDPMRGQSLPSINTHGQTHSGQGDAFGANSHARTYPPSGTRPLGTGLYGSSANAVSSNSNSNGITNNHTPSTSVSSVPVSAGTGSVFSQAALAESPKPLSPEGLSDTRSRSPILSQQLSQQQHSTGRRQADLQSPHSGPQRPKLPALAHPGFPAPGPGAPAHLGTARPPATAAGATEGGNMFAQSDPSVWAYVQALEEKIKTLSEKVTTLEHEMGGLRKQLDTRETTSSTA